MLLKKPKEVGWEEAGGIPENWMTGKSSGVLQEIRLMNSVPGVVLRRWTEEGPECSDPCCE